MRDGVAEKKLCFVIGPIGDPDTEVRRDADWLLKGIIKPVIEQHFPEYHVQRADEISEPGSINSQVIARLFQAPLVIADMSRHNANAFYELAIRHMKQLPTIHMIHTAWKVPFDVMPYRAIPFSRDRVEDYQSAMSALKAAVEEATRPGFKDENPISHALGRIQLEEHASPDQKVLLDRMETLENRLAHVEKRQVPKSALDQDGEYAVRRGAAGGTIIRFSSNQAIADDRRNAILSWLMKRWPTDQISQGSHGFTVVIAGDLNVTGIVLPPDLLDGIQISKLLR